MFDGKAFGEQMVEVVRSYVDEATAPLLRRIHELEKRQPVAGDPGRDGTSVTVEDVAPLIAEAVERAISLLPIPKDGRDGLDGASVDPSEVERMVADGIEKAVATLPAPRDGKDGVDGIGLAGALIDRAGDLVVTLSNGETRSLGPVVGKDGDNGQPGRDGLQVKDIDLSLAADGRTLLLSLDDGQVAYTAEVGVPTMIYRGVFTDGTGYEKGDTVTWAGSLWHCNAETKDKPGEGSADWTLAVKKGRDAKPVLL